MEKFQRQNSSLTLSHGSERQFGNVYLTRNAGKSPSPHCLKGAKFSIADLKWYDGNGEEHPSYVQYQHNPFYYQFTFRNQDKDGREVEFTGKFRPCFPLGGMPPIQPTHLEIQEASGYLWSMDVGIISEESEKLKTRLLNTRYAHFATAVTPAFTIEQRKLLLMFNCAFFMFDDWIPTLRPLSFRKLHGAAAAVADVIRGDTSWEDEDWVDTDGLRPFLLATKCMREEALKYAAEEDASHFFEAYAEHTLSYAVEASQEWNEFEVSERALFRYAHPYLRFLTMGFKCLLEIIMVSSGIVLDQNVRSCFLFQHFRQLCQRQISMVNDLISFHKEMKNKETCNYTILLHVIDGLPLEEALEKSFNEINSLTRQINKLGELLEKQFKEDPNVAGAVNAAKQFVQGHYFYFPFAPRYLHDFAYDCVVECDNNSHIIQ